VVAAAAANGSSDAAAGRGNSWQAGNVTRVADSNLSSNPGNGSDGDASLDGSAGMRGTQPAPEPELPPRDLLPSHVALVGASARVPVGLLAAACPLPAFKSPS
jgi:hypothetical protein